MTTGQRIRARRKELGLSAEYVAERLHVSPATVYRYEKGDIENVSSELIGPLAEVLRTTPAQIMGWSDDGPTGTDANPILTSSDQTTASAFAPLDLSNFHRIPIVGQIAAGLPMLADENIEGYTLTDLNHGHTYFALRVHGDSMDAVGIRDGYLIVVRQQEEVENGEIAVVRVGEDEATVKRFYRTGETITLMPQSTNPVHQPQIYGPETPVVVLGKVVKVEFMI